VASDIEPLSKNPAIAPFLLVAQIALGQKQISTDTCERLLLSEFGGADSVSLRRIRRALIASRGEEDSRTGAELLIAAVDKGEIFIEGAMPLQRVHDLLARARKVLRSQKTQGEDLLWEIWSSALTSEGSSLSNAWRNQALRGGMRGAAADRDLDAMMQLFEAARRFAERFPHSKADSFIRQISQENILGDVITAQGQRPDVVEILTVHAAKGREWEIVAIAGLQEGIWPNLRQRGSLLGSERLVDRLRHGSLPRKELEAVSASGLVEDERRLLHVAVSRAKSELIVTAIQKDDDEPSAYFEEIASQVLGDHDSTATRVPRPITPTALVATLRNELDGGKADVAASLLKRMATEGLVAADVGSWAGVLPISSTASVVSPDALVPVSPSSAEGFSDCGVKWFLERSGGTNGDSTAQVLGSAIHAFAALMEEDPTLTQDDLVAKLRESWRLIDPNTGWVSTAQLKRAVMMIEKFVKYHTASLEERTIVGVEAAFEVTVGRAKIRGSVDRLEVTADGELFIVDFKTGANAISKNDALSNLQMRAYQLAVIEGGFADEHESRTSAGAELVYLGSKTIDATTPRQLPVDADEIRAEIMDIAEGMSGSEFLASINKRCNQCDVRNACPIQSEGRTVME
jgi:RecB family exonuclease